MSLKTILRSTRPAFLLLTPVCVFLGFSTALANREAVELSMLVLALLGALLAHVSVNMLNEYHDFKSGLDLATTRTAFSGGSGALPGHPEMAATILYTGVASLTATLLIGVFFLWTYGMGILPVGIAGLLLIVSYSGWINRHPLLCLLAPGAGFGLLMVAGTGYVLTGVYTPLAWLAAAVPFFLVNNLLLLNQYPDLQADAAAGRYHFPIARGTENSNRVYACFMLATAIVIIAGIYSGYFPAASLIALLPLPLGLFVLHGAIRYGADIGGHPQYLAANVAVTLLTPVLLGVSLIVG